MQKPEQTKRATSNQNQSDSPSIPAPNHPLTDSTSRTNAKNLNDSPSKANRNHTPRDSHPNPESSHQLGGHQSNTNLFPKPSLRANGSAILPLALRPGLLLIAFFIFSLITTIIPHGITHASSVTLTIPSSALSLDITPNSGTVFQKSSAGTINVATDSSYGYSLSIHSKNPDSNSESNDDIKSNDLLNGSNKISSIVSALNESDFQSSGSANTWGYLPSKLNSSVNSDFQPGPTTEPTILDVTDTSSSGTDYGITLATKIDNTLPAGTYHNTFVLTTTTNDPPYDDIMQNWAGCDDLPEETRTLTLLDTRDNKTYTVAKLKDGQCWMTQNLALGKEDSEIKLTPEDSDVVSSFTLFASSDTPNASNTYDSREIHLDSTYGGYYSWYAATAGEGDASKSNGDVEHSICPKGWRLPTSLEFKALNDALGGNTGTVGANTLMNPPNNFKMGGDYVSGVARESGSQAYYWSSTASGDYSTYYLFFESNSVNPQHSYTYIKSALFSVRCISRPVNIGTMQTVSEWGDSVKDGQTFTATDVRDNKDYTVARLADGKLWMTQNLEIENYNLTSADSDVSLDFQIPASTDKPNSSKSYESKELHIDSTFGGYYSWYTATAGEGTQDKWSGDTIYSICPKNWRLPTSAEYKALNDALGGKTDAYGASTLQASPNNFKMGGYYGSGTALYAGDYAYYWSSTANGSTGAYDLYFNSSSVNPQRNLDKHILSPIRCIARTDDPTNVGTMQTVSEWGDSIEKGKTYAATDTRDNKEYTVARLEDGKLWMTKNLEIAGKTLSSTDSDVSISYSLPSSSTSGFSSYNVSNVYIDSIYGGYYTWYAATAGTGGLITSDGAQASNSICPRGWRLPSKQDFINLDSVLGGTGTNNQSGSAQPDKYIGSPNNFKMGGSYYLGSSLNVGSEASYWSSTAFNDTYAYYLSFDSSHMRPQNYNPRYGGYSVRCISRTDDPVMQNVSEWGSSVQEDQTVIATDIRDGKSYTVSRLKDNKLWMTKNLEIEDYNLTSADSDVTSDFQIPASTDRPNSSNSYESKELYIDNTYGGYYTWYAATAGEGTRSVSTDGKSVSHSICSKGWRLPTKEDFIDLDKSLGGSGGNRQNNPTLANTYKEAPNNFLLGGTYNSGSRENVGSHGFYWSSTANSNLGAYSLLFGPNSVNSVSPQDIFNKYGLRSVRCISRS